MGRTSVLRCDSAAVGRIVSMTPRARLSPLNWSSSALDDGSVGVRDHGCHTRELGVPSQALTEGDIPLFRDKAVSGELWKKKANAPLAERFFAVLSSISGVPVARPEPRSRPLDDPTRPFPPQKAVQSARNAVLYGKSSESRGIKPSRWLRRSFSRCLRRAPRGGGSPQPRAPRPGKRPALSARGKRCTTPPARSLSASTPSPGR